MPRPNPDYQNRLEQWLRKNGFDTMKLPDGSIQFQRVETRCDYCNGTGVNSRSQHSEFCSGCGGTGTNDHLIRIPAPNKAARHKPLAFNQPIADDYDLLPLTDEDKKFLRDCGVKP
jgi:hypothetical protein